MILQDTTTKDGWVTFTYKSTWPLYWEIMLLAAEEVIEFDFKDKLKRLAVQDPGTKAIECIGQYRSAGNDLRKCSDICQEHGSVIVSGYSSIMESNLQLTFYNQTNVATIQSDNLEYFEKYGKELYTNYISSIEIKAYVRDTRNSTKVEPSLSEESFKKLPFKKKLQLLFGK